MHEILCLKKCNVAIVKTTNNLYFRYTRITLLTVLQFVALHAWYLFVVFLIIVLLSSHFLPSFLPSFIAEFLPDNDAIVLPRIWKAFARILAEVRFTVSHAAAFVAHKWLHRRLNPQALWRIWNAACRKKEIGREREAMEKSWSNGGWRVHGGRMEEGESRVI